MLDDIHRIDSTLLKPQQTNSKPQYRGNQKKRKEPEQTEIEQEVSEAGKGYEAQAVRAEESPRRILDLQV